MLLTAETEARVNRGFDQNSKKFLPLDRRILCKIKMDAHKDFCMPGISHLHTIRKRYKYILSPAHESTIPLCRKNPVHTPRNLKSQTLFLKPFIFTCSPSVITSVTCINKNSVGLFRNSPWRRRGGSC